MASDASRLPGAGTVFRRLVDSDLAYSFWRSPSAVVASVILLYILLSALLAPVLAVQNPYDLAALDLDRAELPPAWVDGGHAPYLLGTDTQGRDVLSAILYGARISLLIGMGSVLLAMTAGVLAGLVAGYFGGVLESLLMRIGDMVLSIPNILVAVLISAVTTYLLPRSLRETLAAGVLILAISLTSWVTYARLVRAAVMVERRREYTQAAQLVGLHPLRIMFLHILPNVLTSVLVTATLNLGLAILIEATLSFLGVGMPASEPSLGTLIRIGNQFLFSGLWWIVVFPAAHLALIVLSVNLLGDWLRDALNPRLR